MSEPRYRLTPPRWFDAGISFEEPAAFGNPLPNSPVLSTRILPLRDSHSIPAPVLRDLIDQTQRLVYIAAHTAAYGQNPDFSDLRNLDEGVKRVSTLSVSPFSEGSFIIPSELPEEEANVGTGENQKKLSGFAVLDRFHEMLGTLGGADTGVSMSLPIGFIQTVEEMGRIVGRHASRVEYLADTALNADRHGPVVVESSFISRAVAVHERRKGRHRPLASSPRTRNCPFGCNASSRA